jgi:hypothetical protein
MASEAEKARETDPNAPLTAEEAGGTETVTETANDGMHAEARNAARQIDAELARLGWTLDKYLLGPVSNPTDVNRRNLLRARFSAAFTTPPAPKMVRAEVRVNGWRFRAIGGGFVTFGPLADTASTATLRAALALLDRCDANGMWPEGTTVDAETVPSTPPNGVWMVRDRQGAVLGGRESWTEQEARERGRDFDKGWPQDAPHVAVYMVPWEGGR